MPPRLASAEAGAGLAARVARGVLVIAWPAFLAACAIELFVFSQVDPLELRLASEPAGWSRQAIYTVAFLVFWMASGLACALASLLQGNSSS